MGRKIEKPKKNNNTKINPQVTERNISYDQLKASLAFSSVCNRRCLLSNWHGNELKALIDCFKNVEGKTWQQIKDDNGLNYEPKVSQIAIPRPKTLPPDANLSSLRVTDKSRLFGYRTQNVFNIIWFDKNHEVCPENKPKKYSIK